MSKESVHKLFIKNKKPIEELASRLVKTGTKPENFLLICLNPNDPTWSDIAKPFLTGKEQELMSKRYPDQDIILALKFETTEFFSEIIPELKQTLLDQLPPEGEIYTIVMNSGYTSVFSVKPKSTILCPHYSNN